MTFWKEFLTDWITWAALTVVACFIGIAYMAVF